MIALLLTISCALPVGEIRIRMAQLETVGPMRDLVVSLGAAGETHLAGELLPGERIRVRNVPVPVFAGAGDVRPELRWAGDDALDPEGSPGTRGTARFLRWLEYDAEEEMKSLPPGLRVRSRPPVGPRDVRAPWGTLALLPAAFILGLASRRNRAASIAVALLGTTVILGLASRRAEGGPRRVAVLESDAGSPLAVRVTATWERAVIGLHEIWPVLETEEGARIHIEGDLGMGSVGQPAQGELEVRARGSPIFLLRTFEARDDRYERRANLGQALSQAWVREEGEWTYRGTWPTGKPLPPPTSGGPPPGWLAAGLPQGVSVLLGQVAGAPPDEAIWIRSTGF